MLLEELLEVLVMFPMTASVRVVLAQADAQRYADDEDPDTLEIVGAEYSGGEVVVDLEYPVSFTEQ